MKTAVPVVLLLAIAAATSGQNARQRTEHPDTASGFDAAALQALQRGLAARRTKSLLIMRDGNVVLEWYADDSGPQKPHYSASLAKSLVGGMALLAAMRDGRMDPDERAAKYIPAWRSDPLKSKITIRHLATHTSGVEDAELDHQPHEKLPGWKGAFWRRDPDPFSISLQQAPVLFEPGTQFAYSNPGMAALAYAVTASVKATATPDIRSLLARRFMEPMGIAENEWSIGYNRAYEFDGLKLYANWGGGAFTARTTATLGKLMMQRGRWEGRQLAGAEMVHHMLTYAGTALPDRARTPAAPASTLCWWTNFDGVWPQVPRDAFAGAGAGHQLLLVVPSLKLIVVRNGGPLEQPLAPNRFWAAAEQHLFNPVMQAFINQPQPAPAPYPASNLIRGVQFAPATSIVRAAVDSDNWPVTWGDDDALYTSYGDGRGFEPRTERKLSLGWARITGGPEDFRAENVRTSSGEREGDGPKGAKTSGMLAMDGVLYAWARNTGNSQLLWSEDRGRTWQWGFRFETSFGVPAFLNYGRNYAGARDGYVYVYSSDGPSAYETYDGVVLARAPKNRIRERDAYEFVSRLDAAGKPVWSRRIEERTPVFRFPRHCQRLDVVYNAPLRRYLLALGYNHGGGWGIYDAPEPWGPWTTAFHTGYWGLGDTHGYRLPTKWISADGRTMWLIFSGRAPWDAFCLRRLALDTVGGSR